MMKIKTIILLLMFLINTDNLSGSPLRSGSYNPTVLSVRSIDTSKFPITIQEQIKDVEESIENAENNFNAKIQNEIIAINGTNGTLIDYKNEYIKANNICGSIFEKINKMSELNDISAFSSVVGTQAGITGLVTGVLKNSEEKKSEKDTLVKDKSNLMGNMRSFSLGANTVTSVISTIMSGQNISKSEDLIETMENCNNEMVPFYNIYNLFILSLDELESTVSDLDTEIENIHNKINQIKTNEETGTITEEEIETIKLYLKDKTTNLTKLSEQTSKTVVTFENNTKNAKDIVSNCKGFDYKNIETVKNLSIASTVTAAVGTGVSGAGTVTSIMANTNKIKNDKTEDGIKKEKNLNLASNILAGVSIGTSGATATLNAINIEKIDKDIRRAIDCKNALISN